MNRQNEILIDTIALKLINSGIWMCVKFDLRINNRRSALSWVH